MEVELPGFTDGGGALGPLTAGGAAADVPFPPNAKHNLCSSGKSMV